MIKQTIAAFALVALRRHRRVRAGAKAPAKGAAKAAAAAAAAPAAGASKDALSPRPTSTSC